MTCCRWPIWPLLSLNYITTHLLPLIAGGEGTKCHAACKTLCSFNLKSCWLHSVSEVKHWQPNSQKNWQILHTNRDGWDVLAAAKQKLKFCLFYFIFFVTWNSFYSWIHLWFTDGECQNKVDMKQETHIYEWLSRAEQ